MELSNKLSTTPTTKRYQKRFKRLYSGRSKRRFTRYGLIAVNVLLVVFAIGIVTRNSETTRVSSQSILNSSGETSASANPLDQLSSAEIAAHVATVAGLDERPNVANTADSVITQMNVVAAEDKVVTKPQIFETSLKSRRDIQKYTVQAGETITSIANKFGITSDSVRWSNNLTGDAVAAGKVLSIPPVNGIVHTVVAGDTPESLATKYRANKDQIIAMNDAEIGGLKEGWQVIIPDGTQVAQGFSRTSTGATLGGFAWGGYTPVYGRNAYDYGWCTWYAASRVAVPSNWGNANTWDDGARASGWKVSTVPVVGAVAQNNFGWAGHVGVVEAVNEDGSMIKYSDMNGLAGWGRVGYSDWVPSNSKFQYFIYR